MEFYLSCDLMIQSTDENVLEEITLIVECDLATIFREKHCFLASDFEFNRIEPSTCRKGGIPRKLIEIVWSFMEHIGNRRSV
jgi:hypothetical protein